MKTKQIFRCAECAGQWPRWQGQCPGCGAWNTLEAVAVSAKRSRAEKTAGPLGQNGPSLLEDLSPESHTARPTGFPALDTVLGKGLVPGGAVLLGGEPGIGKSTLLLQLVGKQAELGTRAVYVSGEESLGQIRNRAERLGLLGKGLNAVASTRVEDALALLEEKDPPQLIIVDSVQTLSSAAADGIPGSVSQVRAVASELVEKTKKCGTTLFLVGHVTKEGHIAGPKLLEHMVDTVLYLEGDRKRFSRILRVLKNRFGPTDELVVFTMEETGMHVVEDPSTFFLGAREANMPGTAVGMALDGHRPFAVELQALAANSYLSIPRRTALGLDNNRLQMLLAVLEKRLRLNLGQFDIFAKLGGGLNLRDPGMDLPLAASLLSSFYDRPLPEAAIGWGEVDLNGQIRPVSGHDTRLKQAQRLGHKPIIHPDNCKTLQQMQTMLFGK